jgi:hypothetical protein
MQGRFPRTVSEFAEHGRAVIVRCESCPRTRRVPPDVLDALFGPDFDLYDGFAGLKSELRCDQCGEKHRSIDFVEVTERPSGPVSFDESVVHQLELRTLARARNGGKESTATRGWVRRRR